MMSRTTLPSAQERVNEKLPSYMDFHSKAISPPAENQRFYVTPSNGNAFASSASSGSIISFSIPCGSPGVYLNTLETALVFTIKNDTGKILTLDGSALALIDSVDVYYGSSHISSIQGYANLVNTLSDFTSLGQHYVRGVNDTKIPSTINSDNLSDALKSRNGVVIPAGDSETFCLPLVNCLGTLAQKALPLSQLRDSIRVDIRLAGGLDWGVYDSLPVNGWQVINPKLWLTQIRISGDVENALIDSLPNRTIQVPCFDVQSFQTTVSANAGSWSYQIPIKASSVTMLLVTLRDTASFAKHDHRSLARTRANLSSYRFRIGATIIPSTFIDCTGSGAETRMEVMRAMNQLSSSESHSFIDNELFTKEGDSDGANINAGEYGGFCFALQLSAFAMSEILSDGRSTRNEHVTIDATFASAQSPALRVDVYAIKEQLLVAQGGILHYED